MDKQVYTFKNAPAQAPAAVAVPDGWKLVPIEPQPEQLDSAIATDRDGTPASYKTLYIAMVGAALTPPIFAALAATPSRPATEDSSAGDVEKARHQTKLLAQPADAFMKKE